MESIFLCHRWFSYVVVLVDQCNDSSSDVSSVIFDGKFLISHAVAFSVYCINGHGCWRLGKTFVQTNEGTASLSKLECIAV